MLNTIIAFSVISAMFVAVSWGLARGGWQKLHASFPATGHGPVKWQRGCFIRVGTAFHSLLRVATTEESLFLGSRFLLFHPPLCIPWTELKCDAVPLQPAFQRLHLKVCVNNGVVPLVFEGKLATEIAARIVRNPLSQL